MKARLRRRFPSLARFWWMRNHFYWIPMRDKFTRIYHDNRWAGAESRSGGGSDIERTARMRSELEKLLRRLEIKAMVDLPCGDFFWMKEVDLRGIQYVGIDIVPEVIQHNLEDYGSAERSFLEMDITAGIPPMADLILVRDCLVHFSFKDVRKAVANLRASGSTYLLATTFPTLTQNEDIITGYWRPLNLQLPPISFPPPIALINEGSPGRADKSLGLWKLADLPL